MDNTLFFDLGWVWNRASDWEEVLMDGWQKCSPCEYTVTRITSHEMVGFNIGGLWKASCEVRRREEWHGTISER